MSLYDEQTGRINPAKVTTYCIMAVVALVVICVLAAGGCKQYSRYQKRADAENAVKVAKIEAERNYAQIEATKAEAEKRYQESVGIRRAQDEISQTLNPLYIQHEAIEAQKSAFQEGNAQIYIPSGDQGVPLVRNAAP